MSQPQLILIAAVAENLAIGKGLDLPWHLPEDLKHFKKLTLGHPLIMGRRTFDSLLKLFGKPLPKRENVVISHQPDLAYLAPHVHVFSSVEAALTAFSTSEKIFIGGGSSLYSAWLEKCDVWELTHVHQSPSDADVFFPPYRHLIGTDFRLEWESPHNGYTFARYRKIAHE